MISKYFSKVSPLEFGIGSIPLGHESSVIPKSIKPDPQIFYKSKSKNSSFSLDPDGTAQKTQSNEIRCSAHELNCSFNPFNKNFFKTS